MASKQAHRHFRWCQIDCYRYVILLLIVAGIALWLIDTYIPMAGSTQVLLNLVVVIACCVGVLRAVGLSGAVVRMWDNLTHRLSG